MAVPGPISIPATTTEIAEAFRKIWIKGEWPPDNSVWYGVHVVKDPKKPTP